MDLVTYALLKRKVSSISSQLDGLTTGFDYKGSVSDDTDLPSGASIGDVYTVDNESNQEYAWNGEEWIKLGIHYAILG